MRERVPQGPVCVEDMGSGPCGRQAVGIAFDETHGGYYPVCDEHLDEEAASILAALRDANLLSPGGQGWRQCAESKIRQIERLRPLVGPAFEDDPNTSAVIDAALERLSPGVDEGGRPKAETNTERHRRHVDLLRALDAGEDVYEPHEETNPE